MANANARLREEQARNALFSGAGAPLPHRNTDAMGVDELVQTAAKTHHATTRSAQNSNVVLDEILQVQGATLQALDQQGQKITRVQGDMARVNERLTYGERVIRYMSRCCCCWMCDSCTGADPDTQIERKWKRDVAAGRTATAATTPPPPPKHPGSKKPSKSGAAPPQAQLRDSNIQLTEEHRGTQQELQAETELQNWHLDKVGDGTAQMLANTKAMRDAVMKQNQELDTLDHQMAGTTTRVHDINDKSWLRRYK